MTDEFWIQSYTGKKIHIPNIKVEEIDVVDIAHALSMTCRFGGHCCEFYSVAQHSYLVSRMVNNYIPACQALFHDAAEAYLPDLPRPIKMIKALNGPWKILEAKILLAIFEKFNLPWPFNSQIKEVDTRMLRTEARDLMNQDIINEWGIYYSVAPYTEFTIKPLPPREAEALFMMRYEDLFINNPMESL